MFSRVSTVLAALSLLRGLESLHQNSSLAAYDNPNKTLYPWTVGVYRIRHNVYEQICVGSLISEKIVLSAAHCFYNEGHGIPQDEYRITTGNYYRDFSYPEEKQIHQLEDIQFRDNYLGYTNNYAEDIALIRLKNKVDISKPEVQPIAIDWNNNFKDSQLQGQIGSLVFWDLREDEKTSGQRMVVQLPYIDHTTCLKIVVPSFQAYITPDKFCAGKSNGTTICLGSGGGGLAFQHPTSHIWYLRGIVSVSPTPQKQGPCFDLKYSGVTSIARSSPWLNTFFN